MIIMGNSNILSKTKRRRLYLNKVVANKIDKEPEDTTVNINQDTVCVILENTKEMLSIKVNTKIFIEPEVLFSIEIEHIMEFILREKITDEEIEKNIDEIVAPLGAEISYIIASLTKEMLGSHIILPPGIKVNNIEKIK